ncbi:MAG: aminotransferase class IV family protein [Mangrovibacterium sp.]
MCQLLETIKLENGQLFNLSHHNRRLNAARQELFQGCPPINLSAYIQVPENCRKGLFRCRVLYSLQIESVEFFAQLPRTFLSLKLVEHNSIDYHLKYADRSQLTELLAMKGEADEIIIVKNGMLTDCSIGNLVFGDGKNWYSPATPLLAGTQRQKLLDTGLIKEKNIRPADLNNYRELGIINAFFDLGNMPRIKISNIF